MNINASNIKVFKSYTVLKIIQIHNFKLQLYV